MLKSIPNCPDAPQLRHTSCTVIRKFTPWLANSALEQPQVLQLVPPLFQHAVAALATNLSAGGGSLAIAELCRMCAPTVAQHCREALIQAYCAAAVAETWRGRQPREKASANGRTEPMAGPLEDEDVSSIVEGTGIVLAYQASRKDQEVRRCVRLGLSSCTRRANVL